MHALRANHALPAEALVQAIVDDVNEFSARRPQRRRDGSRVARTLAPGGWGPPGRIQPEPRYLPRSMADSTIALNIRCGRIVSGPVICTINTPTMPLPLSAKDQVPNAPPCPKLSGESRS